MIMANKEKSLRDKLTEVMQDDELLFADGFDDAIVGVSGGRVCYDKQLMVEMLVREDWDESESWEFLEFNTWGAYIGERTPIYIDVYYLNKVRNDYENQIYIDGQTAVESANK